MHHYSVILPFCPRELTYASEKHLEPGTLVSVPFRTGSRLGLVRERVLENSAGEIKEIENIVSEGMLDKCVVQLVSRISEHYFCSINQAAKLFLPSFIWKRGKARKREVMVLNKDVAEDIRSMKQKELVEAVRLQGETDYLDAKKTFSLSAIKTLLNKKIIQIEEREIVPGYTRAILSPSPVKKLTHDQSRVFDTIKQSAHQKFLIHGITGSGKTEIYLQLALERLRDGYGSVILVPEIALTTQLIQYFASHFDSQIAVLHSKMSDQERAQEWWRLKTGEANVVLGSRSALFAPVRNLGLVIVDEEHEWTYKQENAPRYHARTIAEMMTELLPECKLVLGSATPDIETYFRSQRPESKDQEHGYQLLELTERVGSDTKMLLPKIEIVDLRDEFKKKNYSIFSDALQEALTETLENNEQAILFLNRRGTASSVVCRECGYAVKCERCDISMTLHGQAGKELLICHHCGSLKKPVIVCPRCKSTHIRHIGVGTQRVESELKVMFPKAKILRADRDTTSAKTGFEKIYNDFREHRADILIGTQMVAKGLDIPDVNLVGVILADIGLHIPDFRSSERTFQLLTQVAGRAGRRDKQGRVIIQTYSPAHPAVVTAAHHDYDTFFRNEIKNRKDFDFPPFSTIIKLTYMHTNKQTCYRTVMEMGKRLEILEKEGLSIAPAAIPRLHGKYRWHIYLQGNNWAEKLKGIALERGWKIDRDPIQMG